MIRTLKAATLLAPLVLAAAAVAQSTPADAMIAKVESGLQSRLQIVGEPVATWSIAERMAL